MEMATFVLPGSVLIEEAARLMGVSRRTVYYRISEGQLQTVRTAAGSTRVIVPSLHELVYLGLRKNAVARRLMAPPFADAGPERSASSGA